MGDWSQGFQGAAGGAMAGAAFGPAGAAIGGALGGLGGLLGDGGQSQYQDQLKQLAAQYAARQAPQGGPAAQAQNSDFRQNQAGLITQLESAARGDGPSAAALQMREAMDRAAGTQAGAAAGAGGRGVNAGAALRNATNQTAAVQAQGARDTSVLRAQEQASARQQLGTTIAQGRQSDENISTFNAGANNQTSLANLQAKLQTMGLNDEAQLKALTAAMGAAGPGMGTQIMAGGASAFPTAMQYLQRNNGGGMQQNGPTGTGWGNYNPGGANGAIGDINSWNW